MVMWSLTDVYLNLWYINFTMEVETENTVRAWLSHLEDLCIAGGNFGLVIIIFENSSNF